MYVDFKILKRLYLLITLQIAIVDLQNKNKTECSNLNIQLWILRFENQDETLCELLKQS